MVEPPNPSQFFALLLIFAVLFSIAVDVSKIARALSVLAGLN